MHNLTLFVAVIAVSAPMSASAELTGGLGLSFGQISADGEADKANNTRLDFNLSYDPNGGVGFALNGASSRFAEGSAEATVNALSGEVFYDLGTSLQVGGYLGTLSSSEILSDNLTSYGLFVGNTTENFSVGFAFGQLESDGDSANELNLRGEYQLRQGTKLSGEFGRAWDEDFGVNSFSISAAHDISEQVNIFGGLNLLSYDDSDERLTTLSLGLAYDLASVSSFSATGWVELSRVTYSDSSDGINRVAFGVSVPLGASDSGAPVGSLTGTVAQGNRSNYSEHFVNGVFGK